MFNLFKKKSPTLKVRETLFGDLPISQWPSDRVVPDSEPWRSFDRAREHLSAGQTPEAITLFEGILAMPGLDSRHYIQAWHFLREAGVRPDASVAKEVFGVVVEVGLQQGLDIVAAYADGKARHFNHRGAAVIWDAPDDSLRRQIESVLQAGKAVADRIGPWEGRRPAAPPAGQARISMLTPSGLHFGQAPFETLAADRLGGIVVSTTIQLMQSLIAKTQKK